MAVNRTLIETENVDTEDDFIGALLAVAANGKPYVFVHVVEADVENGMLAVALEHNSPDGDYSGVRLLLQEVLATLPE